MGFRGCGFGGCGFGGSGVLGRLGRLWVQALGGSGV